MSDVELRALERMALVGQSFAAFFRYGLALIRCGRRFEARVAFCRALDFFDRSQDAEAIRLWFPDLAYKFLDWEVVSPRSGGNKQLFSFEESLVRLRRAGYERHPRPVEVFGLLADGLRGLLPAGSVWSLVYEDLLKSYGEWLSVGFERKNDALLVYVDPEGFVWNSTTVTYERADSFHASETRTFSVQGMSSQQWIELSRFDDSVVRFLAGCSFTELPEVMRLGDRRSFVRLPPNNTAWPVARDDFGGRYYVSGFIYDVGASRGVRLLVGAKKFS